MSLLRSDFTTKKNSKIVVIVIMIPIKMELIYRNSKPIFIIHIIIITTIIIITINIKSHLNKYC